MTTSSPAHGMKGFRLLCWALFCGDSLGLKTKPLAYCMGMSPPPCPSIPAVFSQEAGFPPLGPMLPVGLVLNGE